MTHIQWMTLTLVTSLQTGTTALFFAAQAGYMDVAQLLISHSAPVDTTNVVSSMKCRTLLMNLGVQGAA